MRKIFATIFALAAAGTLCGASPTLQGEADPEAERAVFDEASALAGLFHSPWRNSRTVLQIFFSPAVPENSAELVRRANAWVLMLNGSPGRWQSDFDLRRRLYSSLLMAAADAPLSSGECRALPPWLVAAATRRIAAQKAEERLLGGNFRAPVLRALLERDRMPSGEAVRLAAPRSLSPAEEAWFGELADALFLAGGRKLASREYLRRCGKAARGKLPATNADAHWLPEDPEARQQLFAEALRRVAWHDLAPRPARWALRRLDEVRKLKLPELDKEGKPIPDKFIECDVLELADRLRGRPDAAVLAAKCGKRFFDFCVGDSRRVRSAGARVANLAGHADNPRFRHHAKLRQELDNLYSELRRREKLGDYLDEAEFRSAPVRRIFRLRLKTIEAAAAESMLSEERREWFSRRARAAD